MKIISGLVLERGAVYENTNIYNDDTKVVAVPPLPLLLEHDISRIAGKVIAIVEKQDGIYYVAELEDEIVATEYKHVSAGGVYDNYTNTLLLNEISLTNNPYFKITDVSVVLSNKATEKQKKEKEISNIEHMSDMKEVSMQSELEQLQQIAELVSVHESKLIEMQSMLEEMKQNLDMISERLTSVENLLTKTEETVAASAKQTAEEIVNASMSAVVKNLDEFLANSLNSLLSQLQKTNLKL